MEKIAGKLVEKLMFKIRKINVQDYDKNSRKQSSAVVFQNNDKSKQTKNKQIIKQRIGGRSNLYLADQILEIFYEW